MRGGLRGLFACVVVLGLLISGCADGSGQGSPAPLRATARVAVERADSAEWLATAQSYEAYYTRVAGAERATIARVQVIATREAYDSYSTQVAGAMTRDSDSTRAAATSTRLAQDAARTAVSEQYTRTTYAIELQAKRTATAQELEIAAIKADSDRAIAQWSGYLPILFALVFLLVVAAGIWAFVVVGTGYVRSLQMQNLLLRDDKGVPVVLLLPHGDGQPDVIELPTRLLPATIPPVTTPTPDPVIVVTGPPIGDKVEDLIHYDDLETFVKIIAVTGNWTAREWANKQIGRFLMGSPGSSPPSGYDRLMELFVRRGAIVGRDAATRKPGTLVTRDPREIMEMLTGRYTSVLKTVVEEKRHVA